MSNDTTLEIQKPGQTSLRLREATDVASVCRDIATKTAVQIGKRKYVIVEAWTSIAVAHGCIATIKEGSVQEVYGPTGKLLGIRAIAEIRRQTDGAVLSSAEGFVGTDEETWYGSNGVEVERWEAGRGGQPGRKVMKVIPPRENYAIRSMAQTRAISRACRTAFSHVIVMMNEGLSTTPYEEVAGVSDDEHDDWRVTPSERAREEPAKTEKKAEPTAPAKNAEEEPPAKPIEVPRDPSVALERQFLDGKWKDVRIHFGKANGPVDGKPGKKLGELEKGSLSWYAFKWSRGTTGPKGPSEDDKILSAALDAAINELGLIDRD